MAVSPIPLEYKGATPYLTCKDAAKLITFYKEAFGAKELYRLDMPDGKIGHAEIQIAGGRIMLSDEFPEWGCLSPVTVGGTGSSVVIYVENADAIYEQAVKAGAKSLMAPADQFYGDRSCKLQDPSGHNWMFQTHVRDVSPEEMQKHLADCSEKEN